MNKALLSLSGLTAKALAELMEEKGVTMPDGSAISARMISARASKQEAPLMIDESGLFALFNSLPADHPVTKHVDNVTSLITMFDDRPKVSSHEAEGFGLTDNVDELEMDVNPEDLLDDSSLDLGGDELDLSEESDELQLSDELDIRESSEEDLGLGQFDPSIIINADDAPVEKLNPVEEDLPVYETGIEVPTTEDDGLDLDFLNV